MGFPLPNPGPPHSCSSPSGEKGPHRSVKVTPRSLSKVTRSKRLWSRTSPGLETGLLPRVCRAWSEKMDQQPCFYGSQNHSSGGRFTAIANSTQIRVARHNEGVLPAYGTGQWGLLQKGTLGSAEAPRDKASSSWWLLPPSEQDPECFLCQGLNSKYFSTTSSYDGSYSSPPSWCENRHRQHRKEWA